MYFGLQSYHIRTYDDPSTKSRHSGAETMIKLLINTLFEKCLAAITRSILQLVMPAALLQYNIINLAWLFTVILVLHLTQRMYRKGLICKLSPACGHAAAHKQEIPKSSTQEELTT